MAGDIGPQDRQRPAGPFRPLVAFDFDGTLTSRDSFTAFLAWRAGARRYATGLLGLVPAAAGYLSHLDRGRLKAALIRRFLKGEASPAPSLERCRPRAMPVRLVAPRPCCARDAVRAWRLAGRPRARGW